MTRRYVPFMDRHGRIADLPKGKLFAPEIVDDAGKFGRPQDHITPEIKARADAEWAAMDDRGQLPEGWEYHP